MGKVFFIADTHFGDNAIIRYENRPFSSADEMDAALIRSWNDTVSADDTVFLVGDASAYPPRRTSEIIHSLSGRKLLIRGNHDTLTQKEYIQCGFDAVYDYPIIYEGFWIISHEPMYVNSNMPYANIFGHVHGNPIYGDCSPQSFCVSAERIGYTPIDFDVIKKAVIDNSR